jgi:hypothetical protein
MTSDSLVALIPAAWESVNRLVVERRVDGDETGHDSEVETDDRLVPTRWVLWGIACSMAAGILIVWLLFRNEGIKPWATLLSFVLGTLLSILGYVLRDTLETVFDSCKGSCTRGNGS